MNRRSFLSLLGLGTAGLVLDPERLLWVPGQKTIFVPSLAQCEELFFLDAQGLWIMKEGLRRLMNTLQFSRHVNRTYDEEWRDDTLRVRLGTTVSVLCPQDKVRQMAVVSGVV